MPPPPSPISTCNNYSRVLESEHGFESMSKISLIAPFVVHYDETNENWHMRLKHKIQCNLFRSSHFMIQEMLYTQYVQMMYMAHVNRDIEFVMF